MDGEEIRALLSGLPTAPFVRSPPGTVVIMEEKVVEAGADSQAVAAGTAAERRG